MYIHIYIYLYIYIYVCVYVCVRNDKFTFWQVVVRSEILPFRLAAEQKLAVHGGSNPVLIDKRMSGIYICIYTYVY